MSKFITLVSFVLSTCTAIAPAYAKSSGCTFDTTADGKTVVTCPKAPIIKAVK